MSEVKTDVKVEEVVVDAPTAKEVMKSEYETRAEEDGWVPKDVWEDDGRDPADWRPAKEFVERGDFIKQIQSTKKELKQTQATLTALQRHHQYVFEKAHQTALTELKKEKRMAIREGELEKAEELDEKIDEQQATFEKERVQLKQEQQVANAGVPVEFEDWKSRNTWYESDDDTSRDMRAYADGLGLNYLAKNAGAKPAEVLKYVDGKVRTKFPEKFGKRAALSPTASVDKTTTRQSKREAEFELDDMETQIMDSLVKAGEMTKAQYVAELKKAKGIK